MSVHNSDRFGGYDGPSGSFNSYWNGYDMRYGGTALYPRGYGGYGGDYDVLGFGGLY